jgi:nitrite reductase/ring-hydroxylating ferredoxin subunit
VQRRPQAAVPAGTLDVAASSAVPDRPPLLAVRTPVGRLLLLRRSDGSVAAFPSTCPHLGAPLRRATVEDEQLRCRRHHHRYRLDDGTCVWPVGEDEAGLTLYEAGETGGRVWVRLPAGGG